MLKILRKYFKIYLFTVLLLGVANVVSSQEKLDTAGLKKDSVTNVVVTKKRDSLLNNLLAQTEEITRTLNHANSILNKGFDTVEISNDLPGIEAGLDKIAKNFDENVRTLNLRNLKIAKTILINIKSNLSRWQKLLLGYANEMSVVEEQLKKINQETAQSISKNDSAINNNYIQKIRSLTVRWNHADSSNKANLKKINVLLDKVIRSYIVNAELLDETNFHIINFRKKVLKPEEKVIWKVTNSEYKYSFFEVLSNTLSIVAKILIFFFVNHQSEIIIPFIVALLLGFWLNNCNKKLLKQIETTEVLKANASHVVQHPFAGAFLIILLFSLLFYDDVPASFSFIVWLILISLYGFLFLRHRQFEVKKIWVFIIALYLITNFLGLLSYSSQVERWLQIIINVTAILVGFKVYSFTKSPQNHLPNNSKYVVLFFLSFMGISTMLNIFGFFILSKFFSTAAITALISARILFAAGEIIIESIYILYEANKTETKFISNFDFFVIKKKVQTVINAIAFVIWIAIILVKLNMYELIYEEIANITVKERSIGSFSFSFSNIFIFILIIWISSLISKTLLIIFGSYNPTGVNKKNKWGSTVLLARLVILTLGILLAFAASGIPLDKITIIIGALGVGIGLGLQGVVNNLVSGIILIFEKPIQTGDAIEVGNRYGTVTNIGIRSSKILTVEGSEVIVPNGDLLSQHIVNWTLSSHYRRVEIIIGVSYSSNLRAVETIIKDVLNGQKKIETNPAPSVLVHNFNDSSIDFRLLFWCDIEDWVGVKSEVLIEIFDAFRENNIVIPFPQRDIHVINNKVD